MKYSRVQLSISILAEFCFVLIALFAISCSCQPQAISISGQPAFSEIDTSVTSTGNTVFDENDYFLIRGNLSDKEKLKKIITEFADKYPHAKKLHYDNYLMFFYENSAEVNEDVIKNEEEQYRYKIFDYNKEDDYIGCITYRRDSTKSFVNWSMKYE